jgi:hypothetical protein
MIITMNKKTMHILHTHTLNISHKNNPSTSTPSTLNPKPQTLDPKPCQQQLQMPCDAALFATFPTSTTHLHLNPPPYTLHPTPYTLHPTPQTLRPKL